MSRVEIEAGGRRVVVDHDAELSHVAETARKLWDATDGAGSPGPAYGFTAERRVTPAVRPSTARYAPPQRAEA